LSAKKKERVQSGIEELKPESNTESWSERYIVLLTVKLNELENKSRKAVPHLLDVPKAATRFTGCASLFRSTAGR
jgi:hypothetical protein